MTNRSEEARERGTALAKRLNNQTLAAGRVSLNGPMLLHTTTSMDGREVWRIHVQKSGNYLVTYHHDGRGLVHANFVVKEMATAFFNWSCGVKDAYVA